MMLLISSFLVIVVKDFGSNLDGLFRGLFWGRAGEGKIVPPLLSYLKLLRIMLENSNSARKYTHV